MKRINAAFGGGVLALATVLAFTNLEGTENFSNAQMAPNGPYRDGIYQAKLDADLGREPHLSIARWSSDADRASFQAGYEDASAQLRINPRSW
jgi:hypothetical protein